MKLLTNDQKHQRLRDGIFLGVLVALACFLFWKCRYGIGNYDESFYLTIPYRLYQGDGLFVHEWHLSQMAGVLTLPVVSLFLTINQSTDGLILFMRCVCTFVQCLIALFLYWRLRRFNWLGAVCAALCFALYIPFGIMALCYNSMGIMALVLTGIFLLPGKKSRRSFYVLAGLCFAAAVLCCPYLVAVYVLYVLAVAARLLLRKALRKEKLSGLSVWTVQGALLFTAGAAVAAVAFVAFVLSRGSLGDIAKAFCQIMNDPEHPSRTVVYLIKRYFLDVLKGSEWSKWLYVLLGALFAACLLDRKRTAHRLIHFSLAFVVTLLLMVDHYRGQFINLVMWSLNVIAPFVLLLSGEKINRNLFCVFWVPGILYSLCQSMTSNQHFLAISSASTVAGVGSVMMTAVFAGELFSQYRRKLPRILSVSMAGLLLATQLLTLTDLRYRGVFWEEGMQTQTELVTDGFEAGLYVSKVQHDYYYGMRSNLAELKEFEGETVLYLSTCTWYYLLEDYEMGTYSAWLSGVTDHTIQRLEAYYELNPDKLPDIVWSSKANEEFARQLMERYNYELHYAAGGVVLTRK